MLTEGRQGQRRSGGLLHRGPSPASATANARPPTATSGPSNDTSDATNTAGETNAGRGGGGEEEEPNCPVQ